MCSLSRMKIRTKAIGDNRNNTPKDQISIPSTFRNIGNYIYCLNDILKSSNVSICSFSPILCTYLILLYKVSGIPCGNKLIKTIRYPHMWRYRWFHWHQVCLLNSLVYLRNIFGSSSKVFGNLRTSSVTLGNDRKMFGNVRLAFGTILENFRKSSESGRESSENH